MAGQKVGILETSLHHLQEELQRAIATESYERAAELRDKIRALEDEKQGGGETK